MFRLDLWSSWEKSDYRQQNWSGHKLSCDHHVGIASGAWHTVVGNTRHVQVISQNFVARTMADTYCWEVVYQLGAVGTHQHCILFNLVFNLNHLWPISTHIILQTVSPLRKTLVSPKHDTATQCVVTVNCCIIWDVSVAVLPNFWQNLKFVRCSNCDILELRYAHSNHRQHNDRIYTYSACAQLSLAGMRLTDKIPYHGAIYILQCTTPSLCAQSQNLMTVLSIRKNKFTTNVLGKLIENHNKAWRFPKHYRIVRDTFTIDFKRLGAWQEQKIA